MGLSATQDVQTVQKDMEAQQLNMKTGSAVSGIIMFEVILLGLMGSNNAAARWPVNAPSWKRKSMRA